VSQQRIATCIFVGSGFSNALFGQKLQSEFASDLLGLPTAKKFLSSELIQLLEKIENIELVMSHIHNLAYSNQSNHNTNRRRHIRDIIFLRTAIAVYFRAKFHNLDPVYDSQHKPLIKSFFERNQLTKDNVFFVTTNYDLGIERIICDSFGDSEYAYPGATFEKQRHREKGIAIFKLHGSINWMEDRGPISSTQFLRSNQPGGFTVRTNNLDTLGIDSSLNDREIPLLTANGRIYTPILIPFFYQKDEWLKQNKGWERLFSETWSLTEHYLSQCDSIYFWGYSLPPADHYVFTFLLNIISRSTPRCIVVDKSGGSPLNTTLAKMLRYCYEGKNDYYREHCKGLIEFLKNRTP
jgi:SIR2-like domain